MHNTFLLKNIKDISTGNNSLTLRDKIVIVPKDRFRNISRNDTNKSTQASSLLFHSHDSVLKRMNLVNNFGTKGKWREYRTGSSMGCEK